MEVAVTCTNVIRQNFTLTLFHYLELFQVLTGRSTYSVGAFFRSTMTLRILRWYTNNVWGRFWCDLNFYINFRKRFSASVVTCPLEILLPLENILSQNLLFVGWNFSPIKSIIWLYYFPWEHKIFTGSDQSTMWLEVYM